MGADILHHLHHLEVRAAVTRTLQRGHSRGYRGICIRAGGGNDAGRERGVVSAAVLHVEHEHDVQHPCLKLGVLHIRAEQPQEVLRGGKPRRRAVDIHAVVVLVVVVRMVAVHRQHREHRRELEALPDTIVDGIRRNVVVIG